MKRIAAAALSVVLAMGAAACSDKNPSAPPDETISAPPPGMVVSNVQASPGAVSSIAVSTSLGIGANAVAYVSAAPGTFPGAASAVVRNQARSVGPQSVEVIDGGFDPVAIEAAPGDELLLTVFVAGTGATLVTVKVPPRRLPGVVRTNPSKGRTDVALNVLIAVVFSEPVDRTSVTSSSVALLQDGNAVNGSVQVSANGLTAEFIPDTPLEPQTTYELIISGGIQDLDGDALGQTSSVAFTTWALGTIVVTNATTAQASSDLDPDGYRVTIARQMPSSSDDVRLPAQEPIGVNGQVTIANLPPGGYVLTLSGVSENCTVVGGATHYAIVVGGANAVAFDVVCEPRAQLAGKLAFVSERDGNSEIYTINADGTGLVRLTDNAATDVDPAWSPDGKRIAFVSDRTAGSDIYMMNADGSNVIRLTFGGTNTEPTWSPDGSKIAFSGLRDGQFGIFVMSLDDLGSWRNVGHDSGYQVSPAWSPDGSKIAFTSDWRAYDFLFDVYVANVDGSGITPLLAGPFFWVDGLTFYFQPAWSPDGRRIAVVSCGYPAGSCSPSRIAVANADGSELKTLVTTAGLARPTWSRDGSAIAFSSLGSIRYMSLDGSKSGLISSNGHSPSWGP